MKPLTEHLVGKLLETGEMTLAQTLTEIRRFEMACHGFNRRVGLIPLA